VFCHDVHLLNFIFEFNPPTHSGNNVIFLRDFSYFDYMFGCGEYAADTCLVVVDIGGGAADKKTV